jgi:hypothetical protein
MAKGIKTTPHIEQGRTSGRLNLFHYLELPDWQRKIVKKYPEIYRVPSPHGSNPDQAKKLLAKDYCNLRSGFECGPGWQTLIEQLSSVADALVTKLKDSGLQHDAEIKPEVVKQKVGELRWQGRHKLCSPFDALWLAYLNQIGWESTHTCEMSGELGRIRSVEGLVICLSDREYLEFKTNPQRQHLRYWSLED